MRKNDCALTARSNTWPEANCFAAFVRKLHRHKWVVYAKPPFGGPEQVLRYLGRYTHRVAISNHRLLAFDGNNVTFRWRDYAHGNVQRTMTITAEEFIRRFLLHVLPKGFVRIRHFGFMANYQRSNILRTLPPTAGNGAGSPFRRRSSHQTRRGCVPSVTRP